MVDSVFSFNRVLKNVKSAGKTSQNLAKKRSLWLKNEHFEPNFNAGWPSAIVSQHPVKRFCCWNKESHLASGIVWVIFDI
jgi:hypothetical protein